MYYYSKSTGGFYNKDVNEEMPHDVVEISDDVWEVLIRGQSSGNIIVSDPGGNPVLAEPPPLSYDFIVELIEKNKKQLIKNATDEMAPLQDAVDFGIATNIEIEKLSAWKKYRIEINRVNSAAHDIEWPLPPPVNHLA